MLWAKVEISSDYPRWDDPTARRAADGPEPVGLGHRLELKPRFTP
jgi:hypothetical protein